MSEELAYLAGVIDGEGSITLHKDYRDGRIWGALSIYNSSPELISWIQERFGGKVYETGSKSAFGYTKPFYVVRWYGEAVSEFLLGLIPYLVIKRRKAELFYDLTQVSRFGGNGQNREEQETIYEMFRELDTRYVIAPKGGS